MTYDEFLRSKSQAGTMAGFEPLFSPDFLKPFQRHLSDWAIRKGRSATFASPGLGKTLLQLVHAQNVVQKTNGRVLILAPLAVAAQTVREANKFGIECKLSRDGKLDSKIIVTNYQRLHYFNADDFVGTECDESSGIKAFDGKLRKQVTRFLSKHQYRQLYTATPAPNDFIELGTESEALGELTQSEMLSTFFRASDKKRHSLFKDGDFWNRAKWFFRAHSEVPFWRWVCSWAKAVQKPSDLDPSFDDTEFALPELIVNQHVVGSEFRFPGELFPRIAGTLKEQREERKRTIQERCEKVADLVNHNEPAVVWCQYNNEGDMLEKMIPGAVQVAGKDTDDDKENRLNDFALGKFRILISKPKIASAGLNWQHCGHQTFFPSHSFEQFFQAVRRSLRYGRVGPVRVDIVTTPGEAGVTENLQAKAIKAETMFASLLREMHTPETLSMPDNHKTQTEAPQWL